MLLFRSEEEIERWCEERGRERGATLGTDQLGALARRWYGNRLDPDWRPRTRADSQRILEETRLTGDFWRLPTAS
jgi:hypothetical protein